MTNATWNSALSPNVFPITLEPLAGHVRALDRNERETLAEQYQARLLGHYLRNVTAAQTENVDTNNLTPSLRPLAQAFGASLVGDCETQGKIIPLLKERDEEIREDRASAFDSIVIEAILVFVHKNGCAEVRMDAVAETVRVIFAGRGMDVDVSAEKVGRAVRRLRIPGARLSAAGNGVKFTAEVRRMVHHLAQTHGVRSTETGPRPNCEYCAEMERN